MKIPTTTTIAQLPVASAPSADAPGPLQPSVVPNGTQGHASGHVASFDKLLDRVYKKETAPSGKSEKVSRQSEPDNQLLLSDPIRAQITLTSKVAAIKGSTKADLAKNLQRTGRDHPSTHTKDDDSTQQSQNIAGLSGITAALLQTLNRLHTTAHQPVSQPSASQSAANPPAQSASTTATQTVSPTTQAGPNSTPAAATGSPKTPDVNGALPTSTQADTATAPVPSSEATAANSPANSTKTEGTDPSTIDPAGNIAAPNDSAVDLATTPSDNQTAETSDSAATDSKPVKTDVVPSNSDTPKSESASAESPTSSVHSETAMSNSVDQSTSSQSIAVTPSNAVTTGNYVDTQSATAAVTVQTSDQPHTGKKPTADSVSSSGSDTAVSATDSSSSPGIPVLNVASHDTFPRDDVSDKLTDRIATAVIDRVEASTAGDSSSVVLRLNPPELGHVSVHVSMSNDVVNVRMVASDEAARQIIDRQMNDLRQSLTNQGLSLNQCQVECNVGGQQFFDRGLDRRFYNSDDTGTVTTRRMPSASASGRTQTSATPKTRLDYVA